MTARAPRAAAPLLVDVADGVAWLRLNRPERRNAIDSGMRAAMRDAMEALDADGSVRVAVLTGAGDAFCSGVDLKEASDGDRPHVLTQLHAPVSAPLDAFSKPLIAVVNGPAVGGGLELALACDLRVASTRATFALPEARIGSLPGSGGTQRLAMHASSAIAGRMLFTGEAIDAEQARRAGLVSDVVEPGQLGALAERLAAAVASCAPLSLQAIKAALTAGRPGPRSPGFALERALWALLAVSEDRQEGRLAFRERRRARFRGR